MIQSLFSGVSAMLADQSDMDVIGNNIANANTVKTADGMPYRRKYAVCEAQNKDAFDSEFATASFDGTDKAGASGFSGGGVNARAMVSKEDFKWVYDPTNPNAEKEGKHAGYVAMPNVNIITEMTSMMQATRAYEANSTIIESAKAMASKAMEIGRG